MLNVFITDSCNHNHAAQEHTAVASLGSSVLYSSFTIALAPADDVEHDWRLLLQKTNARDHRTLMVMNINLLISC